MKYEPKPPLRKGPTPMSPKEFKAWMSRCDLNVTHAALALGVSRITIRQWLEKGAPPIARLATQTVVPD